MTQRGAKTERGADVKDVAVPHDIATVHAHTRMRLAAAEAMVKKLSKLLAATECLLDKSEQEETPSNRREDQVLLLKDEGDDADSEDVTEDRSKMATPVESENGCGEKELHKIKERARRAREKQLLARLQSLLFVCRESPPSASEVIARLLLPLLRYPSSVMRPWYDWYVDLKGVGSIP